MGNGLFICRRWLGMRLKEPRWIFLRAYMLVALLVLATGLVLESLLEHHNDDVIRQWQTTAILGSFLYAEKLTADIAESSRADIEKTISNHLGFPASLHPLKDFTPLGARYEMLLKGQLVVLFDHDDHRVFYRRMEGSDWILALTPPPPAENDGAKWAVLLFYSLLAFAVFLWIRPLSRDLDQLYQSALAFGKQDFSARASIPSSSWMAPLGMAFNGMAQRIQLLLKSHRDLTQAVSHELRTPLARIRFSLEMIHSAEGENLQRHCDSMNHDITELNTLIEEMLSYAELNEENLHARKEPVILYQWLTNYLSSFKSGNTKVKIGLRDDHFAIDANQIKIMVDTRLLARALDNLLSNALRFANSRIEVYLALDESCCHLHVLDDGPGIPVNSREAALYAYTRLKPAPGETYHGFGLGLAIVGRIMELHQGKVVIGAAPDGGADISLCWPR